MLPSLTRPRVPSLDTGLALEGFAHRGELICDEQLPAGLAVQGKEGVIVPPGLAGSLLRADAEREVSAAAGSGSEG